MTKRDPMMHIRVPEQLKLQIEAAAKECNRSINAEVVFRLEATFAETEKNGKSSYKLPTQTHNSLADGVKVLQQFQNTVNDIFDMEKKFKEVQEFIKQYGNPTIYEDKKLILSILNAPEHQKKAILTLLGVNQGPEKSS